MNPTTQFLARKMLRERWGMSKNLTAADVREIASWGQPSGRTPIEACLREAGLWEDYKAANHPTWTSFRQWLNRMIPEDMT